VFNRYRSALLNSDPEFKLKQIISLTAATWILNKDKHIDKIHTCPQPYLRRWSSHKEISPKCYAQLKLVQIYLEISNATDWKTFYATRAKTKVKQKPNRKTLTLTASKVTVQMRVLAWTAALNKWTAVLTTGHGTPGRGAAPSEQITVPLGEERHLQSRSQYSHEEVRHPHTAHGSLSRSHGFFNRDKSTLQQQK
jgi:hypothetical protein